MGFKVHDVEFGAEGFVWYASVTTFVAALSLDTRL